MSIRTATVLAVAPITVAVAPLPARSQGLENNAGSGPSQPLAAPPNERNDTAFSYGTASERRTGTTNGRSPDRGGHARDATASSPNGTAVNGNR